ncbi:MFS transporter [Photobacterium leiognathi]|uniref:MFS transporter n=1 Tax=Photobacterium leiognathi TaxID=553611 RepID=UPI002739CB89|nr:MFS transporter [Photobacterium leiognathi]
MSLFRLVSISLLMACSYFFAADMYTPSLPAMSDALNVSSTAVQQTVSVFFIALGISQLICGTIAERFGRKPIALLGSVVFIIGSSVCLASHELSWLIVGRAIQGIGVGALFLLCRTILQDSLSKEQLVDVLSWLSILFMCLPASTPAIGGYLESHYGWQSSFWFMLGLSILLLVVIGLGLKETHLEKNIHATKPDVIVRDYTMIATNTQFLRYLTMIVMANGGALVFYLMGSFIAQQEYQIPAKYFGMSSLALIGCSLCARIIYVRFLKYRHTEGNILKTASAIMLIGALFILSNLYIHSIITIIVGIGIYCFGAGLTTSVVAVSALYLFPKHKGQTGALFGSMQMVGIFTLTFIVSHLTSVEWVMACVLITMALVNISVQRWWNDNSVVLVKAAN